MPMVKRGQELKKKKKERHIATKQKQLVWTIDMIIILLDVKGK